MLPTWTQRVAMVLLAVIAVLLPFSLPVIDQIPFVRYLGDSDWLRITTSAVIFAVAALGLNLLTGVAGQVSLGHSFFMGVGAYTAVFLGGEASGSTWGHDLPMWIWLPGAGLGAALVGVIVAPAAVRVRGLYLAIVTVGLVFIGIHLSRVIPEISGQSEVGRDFPPLEFKWWKEEEPVISFARRRPLAVVRRDRRAEELPVHAGAARPSPSSSPRTSCARAPVAPCRRSAIATSPPRSWACRSSATRRSRSPSRRSSPASRAPCSPPSSAASHPSTGTWRSPSSSSPSSSSVAPARSPAPCSARSSSCCCRRTSSTSSSG